MSTEAQRAKWKEDSRKWRSRPENAQRNRDRAKAWQLAHPEEYKTYLKEYRARTGSDRKGNLKKYGMTQIDYEFLFDQQGGACAICSFKPKTRNLCVDHDHETGKVRGLLCNDCNLVLGKVKDDASVLKLAAVYLEEHGSVPI